MFAEAAHRDLRSFVRITRLRRPADLALIALPGLWGLWLAAGGVPPWRDTALFLLAATAMRCAAWVFNDLAEQRLLPLAPESLVARGEVAPLTALWLFTVLCFVAFVCAVLLGREVVLYGPLVWAWVVGFPFIKRYTLLSQFYLGVGYALTLPMAALALDQEPTRATWLYFTAEALFAGAAMTLYAIPRRSYDARVGIGSLPQLFGPVALGVLIALLQLAGLAALALAGERAGMGELHHLGAAAAAALSAYQHWLLSRPEGAIRAYRTSIWVALAIGAGIALDLHCRCDG